MSPVMLAGCAVSRLEPLAGANSKLKALNVKCYLKFTLLTFIHLSDWLKALLSLGFSPVLKRVLDCWGNLAADAAQVGVGHHTFTLTVVLKQRLSFLLILPHYWSFSWSIPLKAHLNSARLSFAPAVSSTVRYS